MLCVKLVSDEFIPETTEKRQDEDFGTIDFVLDEGKDIVHWEIITPDGPVVSSFQINRMWGYSALEVLTDLLCGMILADLCNRETSLSFELPSHAVLFGNNQALVVDVLNLA